MYQTPTLEACKKADIIILGLSAKPSQSGYYTPLDSRTRSGKIVQSLVEIAHSYNMQVYKTNLVKCAPLDSSNKLRYPTKVEINACFNNAIKEIEYLKPKIIIFLGSIVQKRFEEYLQTSLGSTTDCSFAYKKIKNQYYVAAYHPSYVMRSKNRTTKYISNFSDLLHKILSEVS